jgi:hypothetical protein
VPNRDRRRKKWIFPKILEVATIQGRAVDVHTGPQHEMDAASPGIFADTRIDLLSKINVPRRREADAIAYVVEGNRSLLRTPNGPSDISNGGSPSSGTARTANSSSDVVNLLLRRHFSDIGIWAFSRVRTCRRGCLRKRWNAHKQN